MHGNVNINHTMIWKSLKRITLIATPGNFRFPFVSGIMHRQKYEYRYTVLNLINNMRIVYFFLNEVLIRIIFRSTDRPYYSITISSNSKSKMSHFLFIFPDKCHNANINCVKKVISFWQCSILALEKHISKQTVCSLFSIMHSLDPKSK